MRSKHGFWMLSVLAGSLSLNLNAEVLLSNLDEPVRAATAIGNNPNPNPPPPSNETWYWAAQSFTTDGNAYVLDSVEAQLGEGSLAPPPSVIAEIRADDGTATGPTLLSLVAPDLSGAYSPRTFLPTGTLTLEPNTTYWFVLTLEVPSDGTFEFAYADTNNWVGNGTFGQYAYSEDGGAFWVYGTDFPYFLGVNVTPTALLVGDLNCDGVVSVSDIGPFVLALTDPSGYAAQFPVCNIQNGDINGDGFVTVSDIGPFVALLTGG